MKGVYQSWSCPGEEAIEGDVSAGEVRASGATIRLASSIDTYQINYDSSAAYPWRLERMVVVGSSNPCETFVYASAFYSLKAALQEARTRLRKTMILPHGGKREGAGRKASPKSRTVRRVIYLHPGVDKVLKHEAKLQGLPGATLAAAAVTEWVEKVSRQGAA